MDASVDPQLPSPPGARVAAVTASGGMMGAAIAHRLADQGSRVVVNDRDRSRAEATMTELGERGVDAVLTVADVATRDGASSVIDAAISRWGRLDVMVNVAGGIKGPFRRPLLEITDEEWDRTVEVNLRSAFLCTQLAARVMAVRTSGTIINIGSTSWAGSPHRAHYAAAKAGLVALTRSAAIQLGPLGVRVNVVVPGATLTSIVGRQDSFGDDEDWSAHNPLGRPNSPGDIADAVAFLASDHSRNVSGQILTVAGGLNPSL